MREPFARAILANRWLRAMWGLALLACTAGGRKASAQAYTPPPPPLTSAPCVPTRKDPCTQPDVTPATPATAERFPFPGETTPTAAPAPAPAGSPRPAPGAQPSFPFPGEPAQTGSSSSSSTSSSSSSSSASSSSSDAPDPEPGPDQPHLHDAGSSGSTRFERKHLPKVEDKDNREEQDLQVSKYYASTGDFKAAYLRAKDAIATVPDDPEGHFLLADAARHFNKPEEARTEFEAYLKLDPEGEHVKAAQKALAEMTLK